jgi:hypothetical protein
MIISRKLCFLILLAAAGFSTRGQSATNSSASAIPTPSVFVLPSNPHEGRDPFYPESTRPYASAAVATNVVAIDTLIIRGFSGTSDDRTVIINNHSFGVGDAGDVTTPAGRVHLRCLAIKANSVVIEVNHQRRELSFSTQ